MEQIPFKTTEYSAYYEAITVSRAGEPKTEDSGAHW
jgi:hypothetical protein